ncbi:MAG: division/cell wall cluster transcriptional repressor MraZ [Patescibacteria group bacterium]|nr:division/cell wall cluster transcriptional repressor MraZ [Patescibacteria group bacterium]
MVKSGPKWEEVGQEGGKMLIGQYEGKFGAKNRIALPKKFREVLGDKLIITLGYENSLIVVSEKGWKALLEGTEGKPFIQSETRETQRFLLGGASNVELDSKGRFIIPSYLRDFAKIKTDVVFLGLSRYVEIWDKQEWGEYRQNLEKNIDRISQRLVNDTSKKKADE